MTTTTNARTVTFTPRSVVKTDRPVRITVTPWQAPASRLPEMPRHLQLSVARGELPAQTAEVEHVIDHIADWTGFHQSWRPLPCCRFLVRWAFAEVPGLLEEVRAAIDAITLQTW